MSAASDFLTAAGTALLMFFPVLPAWLWVERHRLGETWHQHRACGMRLRTAWVRATPNVHDECDFNHLTNGANP